MLNLQELDPDDLEELNRNEALDYVNEDNEDDDEEIESEVVEDVEEP